MVLSAGEVGNVCFIFFCGVGVFFFLGGCWCFWCLFVKWKLGLRSRLNEGEVGKKFFWRYLQFR